MIFDICLCLMIAALAVPVALLWKKADDQQGQIINLALKVKELEDTVNRVDESTGMSLHELGLQFETFKNLYGEAAIEEKREAAKAEKAWADGINSIMSYGARFQDRGDTK